MKNNVLTLLALCIILPSFFTGCSDAKSPNPPPLEVLPTIEQQNPTIETGKTKPTEPTATFVPTAVPPLLPCTIAFDSNRDGNWEIYVVGPDRTNAVNHTNNSGDDSDPTWSPDGSKIAFVSNRENEQGGGQFIYVMNADGSAVRQLNLENESKWPDWSHDSRQITYSHKGDIFVINADGSGQSVNLTNSPEEDSQSSWSPDGSKIVWLVGGEGNRNVFVMNADGSNTRQITDNGRIGRVEWTIDGRIITDWGWKDQDEFCHNCVVNADGTNIVDAGGKDSVYRYDPYWMPDGQMVGVANVDMFTGDNEIYLVGKIFPDPQNLGAGFFNLTNNPADDRNPDWPANCGPRTDVTIVDIQRPKEPGQIVIGYAGDSPEQWQRKNNFQKACDDLGIQCVYGEIASLIETKVDAIVQNVDTATVGELTPAIDQARQKEIPVFLLDTELNVEGVYSVTVDRHQLVNTSLEWMFEKIGGQGDFAWFDFQPDNSQTIILEETLKKFPEINVVTKEDEKYNFKEEKYYASTLMEDHPNLKAIWANDAYSNIVLGMADLNFSAEKWPLLVCEPTKEGLFIWKDRLKDHPGMQCIAASNPPGIAYDAVYAAFFLINGAQIDVSALGGQYGQSLYVDIPVVTNENLLETIEKINFEDDRYIVDDLMKPETIRERWFLE